MENEKTLVLIKPDALVHENEIKDIFFNNDLNIERQKYMELDEDIVREHYAHLVNFDFFPKLRDYMMSGPILAMVLSGNDAVARVRTIIGPTDSSIAPKDTIRGMFGVDKTRNAVHASDSVENANIEIERFFDRKVKKLGK